QGARSGFGALLLGVHDADGALRYCGNCGSGFAGAQLQAVHEQLQKRGATASPFADAPAALKAHWVRPTLVAEVVFSDWTREGRVRHAVFKGLRDDKPARSIRREEAPA